MTAGRGIRDLVRACKTAALATALRGDAGQPYASLVLLATALDASPILLLSDLSEHAKNLAADARLSLLAVPEGMAREDLAPGDMAPGDMAKGAGDPLARARASLIGRAIPAVTAAERARFLARHPDSAGYAGFTDFRFYRVAIERAHLVAGFGRVRRIEARAYAAPVPAGLAEAEAGMLAHMNADHADAVRLYATALLGLPDGPWRMVGLDAEGADLRAHARLARLRFDAPLAAAAEARDVLVELARRARGR